MQNILADYSVTISEFKKHPDSLLKELESSPVAIINHNIPEAYLIPAKLYEELLERLEDYELGLIVKKRQHEKPDAIEIAINDL